jgi:tetratricopeptide (TPR) repeat protein
MLAIIAFAGISYSCSDDFFTEPAGNRITPEDHYQSQKDLFISMFGACVPLQNALPKLLLVDGLRSDLLDVTSSSDAYMLEINEHNFSVGNPYLDGADYYKTIVNINEILNNVDKVWEKDPTTVEYLPKFVNGALITIRSWCYFILVKMYGQAALISDNMASLQASQTFLSKQVMIDTLINQLSPYVFTSTVYEEPKLPGPNTKALLGELYLEKNQYDSAVHYLKLGLESYGNTKIFKVGSDFAKEKWELIFYNEFVFNGKGTENLFNIPYDSHRDQYNEFTGWTINYRVKPTAALVNSYNNQPNTDKTIGDLYRGKGFTFDTLPGQTSEYYVSKYNLEKGDPYSTYIILSRAADLHLLLAEALNRTGDSTTAMLLVNRGISSAKTKPAGYEKWTTNKGIRGRVNLNPVTIPSDVDKNTPAAVQIAIEDLIMNERALELAFEGKRFFDLVRIAERRNDPGYLANKVAAKFSDPAQAEMIRNKLMDPNNWYLK